MSKAIGKGSRFRVMTGKYVGRIGTIDYASCWTGWALDLGEGDVMEFAIGDIDEGPDFQRLADVAEGKLGEQSAAKREPVVIIIAKLASGSYRASLDENRWESGRTEDIAIAKLVVNRGRELGIRVTFTRGQAS